MHANSRFIRFIHWKYKLLEDIVSFMGNSLKDREFGHQYALKDNLRVHEASGIRIS
jgi:hypothetical protein